MSVVDGDRKRRRYKPHFSSHLTGVVGLDFRTSVESEEGRHNTKVTLNSRKNKSRKVKEGTTVVV